MKLLIAASTTISLLLGGIAHADDCRDVLSVATNSVQSVSYNQFFETVEWYIFRDRSSFQRDIREVEGSTSFSIPVAEFLFQAESDGRYYADKIRSWREIYENTGSVTVSHTDYSTFTKSEVDQGALTAWSDCMRTRDWIATISGDIKSDFSLSLAWDGHPSVKPRLRANVGLTNATASEPIVFRDGITFEKEDAQTQIFSRTRTDRQALVTLNLTNAEDIVIDLPAVFEEPVPTWPAEFRPLRGAKYTIEVRHSDKCLHVRGSQTENRTDMWQWECSDRTHFQFIFDQSEEDYFRIRSAETDKCFHIRGASSELREPLWQWTCEDKAHFLFRFIPSPEYEGYYSLQAKHSGLCLHIRDGSTANRAPVWQWGCQTDPHFLFKMNRVN